MTRTFILTMMAKIMMTYDDDNDYKDDDEDNTNDGDGDNDEGANDNKNKQAFVELSSVLQDVQ